MSWDAYAAFFVDGIPYGDIISTVFIVGLCALGLLVAKRMYKQL